MSPIRTEHIVSLVRKQFIASNVLELRFTRPANWQFKAGQFVQFKIPAQDEFVWRSYSIASAPASNYLDFCLKIIPGGKASEFFNVLSIGDKATFRGPDGFFVITEAAAAHKIFIGTGTGLAPLISILSDRVPQKIVGDKLSLIFGVRTEKDLFWQDRLQALATQSSQFNYQTALSRPENEAGWAGLVGRVNAHIPAITEPAEYYICGSLEMIKDVRAVLLSQKIPMKHIHFEIF